MSFGPSPVGSCSFNGHHSTWKTPEISRLGSWWDVPESCTLGTMQVCGPEKLKEWVLRERGSLMGHGGHLSTIITPDFPQG